MFSTECPVNRQCHNYLGGNKIEPQITNIWLTRSWHIHSVFEEDWEKMKLNELKRQTFCQWVKHLESCTDNTLNNRTENGSGQKTETYLLIDSTSQSLTSLKGCLIIQLTLYFFLFSISSLRLASHKPISVSTFFSRSSRSCNRDRKVPSHLEQAQSQDNKTANEVDSPCSDHAQKSSKSSFKGGLVLGEEIRYKEIWKEGLWHSSLHRGLGEGKNSEHQHNALYSRTVASHSKILPQCVPSVSQKATVSICPLCCTWFGYYE